jgi:hypothetical protein
MLPPELIDIITFYTGDYVVAWVLRHYLTPSVYTDISLTKRRVLIYGQVQSGKTAAMMDVLHQPLYTNIPKIIVIQNSLLVLQQYCDRFTQAQIPLQIITKDTKTITSNVLLLINNQHRYTHYCKIANRPTKYILLMDEADAYGQHALSKDALHEYYVTATPHHSYYKKPKFFHRIIRIKTPEFYQGLRNIQLEYDDSPIQEIVARFRKEPTGMMLINSYRYVSEMSKLAKTLTKKFPRICFVTLNTKRTLYLNKVTYKLRKKPITKIIDLLEDATHIVFISNRMSLRGLSYTSSNYTRHLTHQYSDLANKSVTNSLQRMRLFGIYRDQHPVKLILPTNNEEKIQKMKQALEINYDVCRWFA